MSELRWAYPLLSYIKHDKPAKFFRYFPDVCGLLEPLQFLIPILCYYCPISINSAGPVTRDAPAEILVSADAKNGRDLPFFSAGNFYFYFFC
jgi:hypothetical protein